jgi:hypothetical protein
MALLVVGQKKTVAHVSERGRQMALLVGQKKAVAHVSEHVQHF